ncbi:MAG: hypothetical protein JWO41_506 [Candidatus Saccharibacteria bacterium]|nr:hypothetical protein [Candidatus Saccharibacteria bacterium]
MVSTYSAFANHAHVGYHGLDMSVEIVNEEIKSVGSHRVFPLAYGNEEETGLMDTVSGVWDEPYYFCENLSRYIPKDIIRHVGYMPTLDQRPKRENIWTEGGFRVYPGGVATGENTNFERATPEVKTLADFVRYVRGSELLSEKMIGAYVTDCSARLERPVLARQHRRTIDSHQDRKACHDNFAIPRGSRTSGTKLPSQALAYLSYAPLIDGAGFVDIDSVFLSQKIGGLHEVEGYGYFGRMYRYSHHEGTPRLEVGCKDINISDYAVWMRAGVMALVMGMAGTDLVTKLPSVSEFRAIQQAQAVNHLGLRLDGTISASMEQVAGVDFLHKLAELSLTELSWYVEQIPDEMAKVATELYSLADDLKKVFAGTETISLVADRLDWAAKFERILRGIDRGTNQGKQRSLTDVVSRYHDLDYDYKGYHAEDGELKPIIKGYGYRLRDKGKFKGEKPVYIAETLTNPPRGTRAAARTELMRGYRVNTIEWDEVQVTDLEHLVTVSLPNVLDQLEEENYHELQRLKPLS